MSDRAPDPAAGAGSGAPRRRSGPAPLRTLLFVLLAVLTVAAFAVTRAVRATDDIVNTVVLTPTLERGDEAEVGFTLTKPDSSADVLIVNRAKEQVRALALDVSLDAGPQELSWDGRGDDGEPVAQGVYGIRVILGELGRDIKPPGTIRVFGGASGEGG